MPDIRHQIQIDAPAGRIFALVSTAAGLAKWWAADVTEDASAKTVELGFFKRSTIYRLKPIAWPRPAKQTGSAKPARSGPTRKSISKLTENAGKTTLQFTHADWQSESDYFTSCNTTWAA